MVPPSVYEGSVAATDPVRFFFPTLGTFPDPGVAPFNELLGAGPVPAGVLPLEKLVIKVNTPAPTATNTTYKFKFVNI